MADNMKLAVQVDVQTNTSTLSDLTDKVEKAKKAAEEMAAKFGEGSEEVKKAVDEVTKLEAQLNNAKAAGENIDQPVKSLKAQLKEANNDLQLAVDKFGAMSPEAAKAAAKVATLKDKIGDAKTLSDAFNPDAKFKGLSNAIQGAVGAFTALQGAQALFGNESKEVQETLVKVQGALALSQGVNSVLEAKDSFVALGAQMKSIPIIQRAITAAQWLWNAAMAANPIGAIVAAIALLIAGIVALTSWFKSNAAEAKKNEEQIKANKKALEDSKKQYEKHNDELKRALDYEYNLAKARGASAEELRKLALKQADETIETQRAARAKALLLVEQQKLLLAQLEASGASDEQIKAQKESVKTAIDQANQVTAALDAAKIQRVEIERKQNIEIAQERTNADNDAKKKAKERAEQNKKDAEEALKEGNRVQAELSKSLLTQRQQEEATVEDEYKEKKKALIAAGIKDFTNLEAWKTKQLADINDKYRKQEEQNEKDAAEKRKQILQKIYDVQNATEDIATANKLAKMTERQRKEFTLETQYQKDIDDALAILNDETLGSEEERQKLYYERRKAIDDKYNQGKKDIAKNDLNEAAKKLEGDIANNDLALQARKNALDSEQKLFDDAFKNKTISEEEYNKKNKEFAERRKAIRRAELEAQLGYARQFGSILSGLADVLGKNTKAGKKAAIAGLLIDQGLNVAKITMDTIASTKAIATKYAKIPGGQIPAAIEIGLNIAQGALSVAKAVQAAKKGIADINSAGGGGSESGGGGGGTPDLGTAAPMSPTPETTALPQDQINQLASANAATRAYVIESDVTNNQERITRINRAARIS